MSEPAELHKSLPFRWNEPRERAATLVAEDKLSDLEIATELDVSRRTLANWKLHPDFQARVDEHVAAFRAAVRRRGIAIVENRVDAQQDRWRRMKRLIEARAAEHVDAPGGDTGLLVRQEKQLGVGLLAERVTEYAFDAALAREMRELEQQAAKELGQWTEKRDIVSDGQPLKVLIGVDVDQV